MAKFVVMWRFNPNAPWPTDPVESAKLTEAMFARQDNSLKTGELLEFGFFTDGTSGYTLVDGDANVMFRRTFSFYPWIVAEVHEIVPYETGKELAREVLKAQAEAMAEMKR